MRATLVTCLVVSLAACASAPKKAPVAGPATPAAASKPAPAARPMVAKILDPKFNAAATAGGALTIRLAIEDAPWPLNADSCWPDYIIRPPKK
jgi:hypothetical protein